MHRGGGGFFGGEGLGLPQLHTLHFFPKPKPGHSESSTCTCSPQRLELQMRGMSLHCMRAACICSIHLICTIPIQHKLMMLQFRQHGPVD